MYLLKWRKRRKFYEGVKFSNKDSERYLKDLIFYYAKDKELRKFENITNYLSHATEVGNVLDIKYPIEISGMSLYDIKILDSNNKTFHIRLLPDRIIYYEMYKNIISLYTAKYPYKIEGNTFYKEKYEYFRKE